MPLPKCLLDPPASLRTYGILPQVLENLLEANPTYRGYGPHGEAPLTSGERMVLSRWVAKDLRAAHFDHGNEFFSELWSGSTDGNWGGLRRQLATCNWLAACGWAPIWKAMLRKSCAKAKRTVVSRKPLLVGEAVRRVLEGIG